MARYGSLQVCVASSVLLLLLCLVAWPVAAVDVRSLVEDLCHYHVLDSDTCSAQALVDCLADSGDNAGAMQQCAAQHDPEAQKFVAIYAAATKPDYVRLIELAGPVVACKLLPPGPPTDVLCGAAIRPIIAQAFGKAAKLLPQAEGSPFAVMEDVGHFMDHEVRERIFFDQALRRDIASGLLAHADRRRIVATQGFQPKAAQVHIGDHPGGAIPHPALEQRVDVGVRDKYHRTAQPGEHDLLLSRWK